MYKTKECGASPSKHLNVATHYKKIRTGQKMSCCCLTSSGLWGSILQKAPVQLNMLKFYRVI